MFGLCKKSFCDFSLVVCKWKSAVRGKVGKKLFVRVCADLESRFFLFFMDRSFYIAHQKIIATHTRILAKYQACPRNPSRQTNIHHTQEFCPDQRKKYTKDNEFFTVQIYFESECRNQNPFLSLVNQPQLQRKTIKPIGHVMSANNSYQCLRTSSLLITEVKQL